MKKVLKLLTVCLLLLGVLSVRISSRQHAHVHELLAYEIGEVYGTCPNEDCGFNLIVVDTTGDPTCTEGATIYVECEECGYFSEVNLPALGHDYHLDSSRSEAATCVDQVLNVYVCSRCNSVTRERTPATGKHSYSYEDIEAPTCTENGTREYVCDVCGDTYYETIKATGHSYSSKVTKAATCTKAGIKTYTCKNCGDSYTEAIKATGHSYTSKITKKASCTEDGIKTFT